MEIPKTGMVYRIAEIGGVEDRTVVKLGVVLDEAITKALGVAK